MNARLAEYLSDPERGRTRRTALIVVVVVAAAGGLWGIASARQKPPRAGLGAAPMQLLPDGRAALVACVCPGCGAVLGKQPGRDCEEIACPRCRTDMKSGFYFAGNGGAPAPVAAGPSAAPLLTPDQRDRLLDLGPLAFGPFGAPTMDPRFMATPGPAAAPAPMFAAPAAAPPAAAAPPVRFVNFIPQRPGASNTCVCAGCGTRVPNDGHLYCPGLRCPACGRTMMAGVRVGATPAGAQPHPAAPDAPPAKGELVAATTPPCIRAAGPAAATAAPARPGLTYSAPVADIVQRNCLRCHGAALRNLSNYQNLKSYAASGLLPMMIQPGGPMSHFLAPAEAQQLLDWVDAGQPR